jgi:hypothetical protein
MEDLTSYLIKNPKKKKKKNVRTKEANVGLEEKNKKSHLHKVRKF